MPLPLGCCEQLVIVITAEVYEVQPLRLTVRLCKPAMLVKTELVELNMGDHVKVGVPGRVCPRAYNVYWNGPLGHPSKLLGLVMPATGAGSTEMLLVA